MLNVNNKEVIKLLAGKVANWKWVCLLINLFNNLLVNFPLFLE